MSQSSLQSSLEALLFVSGEALSLVRLEKILGVPKDEIRAAGQALAVEYQSNALRGLMILSDGESLLMATKPEHAPIVEALTKSELQENLSKAALEVLSIVAYRSPISRSEIDAIRGVNCSFTLRNLLLRDLISREGNPSDSRGYLYRPTFRFLESLGLGKISELPDYETLSQDERLKLILAGQPDVSPEEEIKTQAIEE
jgi:segregation and condensation protein B